MSVIKVFALPILLLFTLLAPGQALAASGVIEESGSRARLILKLDNFSDKGAFRIRDVDVRYGQKRWDLNRLRSPYWASRFKSSLNRLAGKTVRVVVKRRKAKSKGFDLTFAAKKVENIDKPIDQPIGQPDKQYSPGISNLQPQWSADEEDFTTLCPDGQASFEVNLDETVSFDGKEGRSGNFKETVAVSPGQRFTIRVGNRGAQSVRCRPSDLPLPEVENLGPASSQFYLVAPTLGATHNYLMVLNQSGTPLWWYKDNSGTPLDFKLLDSNTFAWVRGVGPFSVLSNHYDLRGLDGSLKGTVSPVGYGADHHDMQRTSDGGYLMVIYAPRDCPNTPSDCEDLSPYGGPSQANVIDGIIQKVDGDGNLVWQWNSRDHISLAESGPWVGASQTTLPNGQTAYDIIHLNSVAEDGSGFVFSARHLDAVIRAEPGKLDWKLGGTSRAESLVVENDPLGADPLGGQHDARILADGSLTIHDNGTRRGRAPRMVRYQLSPGKATLLESISDPKAPGSFCCGGGRRLSNGHWAVSWGANSLTAEYDESGKPLRRFYWPGGSFSYRVVPTEAGELDGQALREGMDSQFPR